MDQGALEQSLETLKDAVALIRQAFPAYATSTHNKNHKVQLQRAISRMAKPDPARNCRYSCQVISHDNHHDLQDILCQSPQHDVVYPIRMEDHEPIHLEFQTAVLLHNLALAHVCASRQQAKSKRGKEEKRHQVIAFRLFSLSNTVLANLLEKVNDESKVHRIHVISALALRHIVMLLEAQGDKGRAEAAATQLRGLTQIVSKMGAIVCVMTSTTAGAA